MKFEDVTNLAESLLKKHGLDKQGWQLRYDRSLIRAGVCRYHKKIISLSYKLMTINDRKFVNDTILHEIAHALAGHTAGHGWGWKVKCVEIGCNPVRTYNPNEVVVPELKYMATCPKCGKISYRTRDRKRTSCGTCSGGYFNEKYLMVYKINPKYLHSK